MNQIALAEIENNILQLPADEQLRLISRVAEKLRTKLNSNSNFESQLAEMANDTEIKRELMNIEKDFYDTEFDGLAK